DGKQLRRIHQFRTQGRDFPGPAEISRAQEDEGALLHLAMLFPEIFFDDVALRAQPGFVVTIILAERHPGPLRIDGARSGSGAGRTLPYLRVWCDEISPSIWSPRFAERPGKRAAVEP